MKLIEIALIVFIIVLILFLILPRPKRLVEPLEQTINGRGVEKYNMNKNKDENRNKNKDENIQQIIPHLYIGTAESTEPSLLKKYNIKYILNMRRTPDIIFDSGSKNNTFGTESSSKIIYKQIPISDLPSSDIINYFNEAVRFIDQGISREENVLVHCRLGRSRSPTIIAAYLMWQYHMSRDEALELIKRIRPIINPNRGFMLQLMEWQDYLNRNNRH